MVWGTVVLFYVWSISHGHLIRNVGLLGLTQEWCWQERLLVIAQALPPIPGEEALDPTPGFSFHTEPEILPEEYCKLRATYSPARSQGAWLFPKMCCEQWPLRSWK
jgi:hypothetical protein